MMQALDARDQHAARTWPVKRRLLENLTDEAITRAPYKVESASWGTLKQLNIHSSNEMPPLMERSVKTTEDERV